MRVREKRSRKANGRFLGNDYINDDTVNEDVEMCTPTNGETRAIVLRGAQKLKQPLKMPECVLGVEEFADENFDANEPGHSDRGRIRRRVQTSDDDWLHEERNVHQGVPDGVQGRANGAERQRARWVSDPPEA